MGMTGWWEAWRERLAAFKETTEEDLNNWREAYRETLKALRATQFYRVTTLILLVILLASIAMNFAEPEDSVKGLWDSLWWAMVTMTTVGYGDVVPKTPAGRLIGMSVMVSGILLVSLMTAAIASVFVSRKIKEGEGLDDIRDRDHVVICGWNENGLELIQNMFHDFKPKVPIMVLVNELTREAVDAIIYRFPDISIRYVRGNFTKEEILARANIKKARAAVVLADTAGGHPAEKADERTIFACLAIKSVAPKVKTCAELRNSENREHLRRAKVDEIVVRGEYNAAILAASAANTGLSFVLKKMMDVDEPNKLWRIKVPDRFVGKHAGELADHFQHKYSGLLLAVVTETNPMRLEDILSPDATAIDGFIKRKFEESGKDFFAGGKSRTSVQINPPRDYLLTRHDFAIVVSAIRPSEISILEKSLDLVTGTGRPEAK